MRHGRHGPPERVLRAALALLPGQFLATAPIITSAPLGPSRRRYANTVALISSPLEPDDLLDRLQSIERDFGRKQGGQRWSSRVLDLDIVLWSSGPWSSPGLTVPHPLFRQRVFVLGPACKIAADWRDPITGLTLRQLKARLTKPRPLPKRARGEGP